MRRGINNSAMMAAILVAGAGAGMAMHYVDSAPSRRRDDDDIDDRTVKPAPKMVSSSATEIEAHNAAVEARKQQKRSRQYAMRRGY